MNFQKLRDFISAAGGRRFLIVVGAGIVDTILLYAGKLNGGEYVTLTLATVAAYITAGTFQKHSEVNAGKPSE